MHFVSIAVRLKLQCLKFIGQKGSFLCRFAFAGIKYISNILNIFCMCNFLIPHLLLIKFSLAQLNFAYNFNIQFYLTQNFQEITYETLLIFYCFLLFKICVLTFFLYIIFV